jgi:hypothetical protein
MSGAQAAIPPAVPSAASTHDRARGWLRAATGALAALAAAAATVSWDAQYVLVRDVKHAPPIAALEAGIPASGRHRRAAAGLVPAACRPKGHAGR